jgi:hypothetical protein
VVAASAWIAGWRGISARGVAAMTVVLAAYLYVRFVYLGTGTPELTERSSGYLLQMLDPSELQRRFGAHPLTFHAYNVAASLLAVLFAEPRSGVFEGVRAWIQNAPLLRVALLIATSSATTALLAWTAVRRLTRRAPLDDTARFAFVFLAVLAANAVLSFAYTKDEIMSTAGVFYALATFGAMREGLTAAIAARRPYLGAAAALMLCLLTVGWTVRSVGVHYLLRSQALKHQLDWVDLPDTWRREGEWPNDPAAQALVLRLRAEAVHLVVPNTRLSRPEWPSRLWID